MGVGGKRHAPAALHPGKTRYPLYRRLVGPQGQSEGEREISPSPGIDLGYCGNQDNVHLNMHCENIIQEYAHKITVMLTSINLFNHIENQTLIKARASCCPTNCVRNIFTSDKYLTTYDRNNNTTHAGNHSIYPIFPLDFKKTTSRH
jgi:hypothetical protein